MPVGRPRIPKEVAEISGQADRHPGRYKDRPARKPKSIGPAPKRFTELEREMWDELNEDYPWLGRSDRSIVTVAARLMARFWEEGQDFPVGAIAQLRQCISSMGGTPADYSKIMHEEDEQEDPSDAYFN